MSRIYFGIYQNLIFCFFILPLEKGKRLQASVQSVIVISTLYTVSSKSKLAMTKLKGDFSFVILSKAKNLVS